MHNAFYRNTSGRTRCSRHRLKQRNQHKNNTINFLFTTGIHTIIQIQIYRYKKPEIGSYVFINRCGRPYKTNNVDKKFRYIRKCISEIYPDDDFTDITPHCLRHTFATAGVNAGVPIKSMQALLGHANTKTLLDTYMHIGQEDKRISINMIEETSTVNLSVPNSSDDKLQSKKWSKV